MMSVFPSSLARQASPQRSQRPSPAEPQVRGQIYDGVVERNEADHDTNIAPPIVVVNRETAAEFVAVSVLAKLAVTISPNLNVTTG
jgi:hypothetical protein